MPALNPFIYSRALKPVEFQGRRSEVKKIFGKIASGQSVAVIGQPHVGKTSLLEFIQAEATRRSYLEETCERCIFSFLDVLAAQSLQSTRDFWCYVIHPLRETDLAPHCQLAEAGGFDNLNALEPLFNAVNASGRRLVLLLDEFDALLSHRALNSPVFYGGLRSLASRTGGLVLVIAARKPLGVLNTLTQELNPHGSPYFNTFVEIQLGALEQKAFDALLDLGGNILTKTDREYILRVSGRHPYLAQTAAAMLWDAHDEELAGAALYQSAGQNLHRQSAAHFSDTWNFWTNEMRKAVTAVALAQIPRLAGHQFKVSELVENFDDFGTELDALQVSGTLMQNENGEWIVAQDALLWWLADELRRNVRNETAFADWVRAQEMDSGLTEHDQEQLNAAAQKVLSVVGKGATTLIESLAKGFGEILFKQP